MAGRSLLPVTPHPPCRAPSPLEGRGEGVGRRKEGSGRRYGLVWRRGPPGSAGPSSHREIDAFGNILEEFNPTDPTGTAVFHTSMFAYTGREWDGDVNLYYYRARWYAADAGRFISNDPIGFAAGDTNVSRYVGNSAPNATDPSGLQESVDLYEILRMYPAPYSQPSRGALLSGKTTFHLTPAQFYALKAQNRELQNAQFILDGERQLKEAEARRRQERWRISGPPPGPMAPSNVDLIDSGHYGLAIYGHTGAFWGLLGGRGNVIRGPMCASRGNPGIVTLRGRQLQMPTRQWNSRQFQARARELQNSPLRQAGPAPKGPPSQDIGAFGGRLRQQYVPKSGTAGAHRFKPSVTLGPEDEILINRLRNRMNKKGWQGEPIVVRTLPDGTMEILDGHHRVRAAARSRKVTEIPWREGTPEEVEYYLKHRQQF